MSKERTVSLLKKQVNYSVLHSYFINSSMWVSFIQQQIKPISNPIASQFLHYNILYYSENTESQKILSILGKELHFIECSRHVQ